MRKTTIEQDGAIQRSWRFAAGAAARLKRKAATVLLVAVTISVGYHAIYGDHGFVAYRQQVLESQRLEKENAELAQRNERAAADIKSLKTDRNTIEREAREQLRYVRPNDVVITIPQAQAAVRSQTARNSTPKH